MKRVVEVETGRHRCFKKKMSPPTSPPPPAYYCTLCLKHISTCSGSKKIEEYKRTLILLGRWLGVNLVPTIITAVATSGQVEFRFCEDCDPILGSFSHWYDQVKRLELRVEWNIWKLQKIASLANRVPSRVAGLTKFYTDNERLGELQVVQEWRKLFIKKCTQKLAARFPKVTLSKVPTTGKVEVETKCVVNLPLDEVDLQSPVNAASDATAIRVDTPPPLPPAVQVKQDPDSPPPADLNEVDPCHNDDDDDHNSPDACTYRSGLPVSEDSVSSATATTSLPEEEDMTTITTQSENNCSNGTQEHAVEPASPTTTTGDNRIQVLSRYSGSRLRARHQCPNCLKTFSTGSNLKCHQNLCEPVNGGNEEDLEEWEDAEKNSEDGSDRIMMDVEEEEDDTSISPNSSDNEYYLTSDCDDEDDDQKEAAAAGGVEGSSSTAKISRTRSKSARRMGKPSGTETKTLKTKLLKPCSICGLMLRGSHKHHFRTNHKTDGLEPSQIKRCKICPAYFLNAAQLRVHIRKLHKTGTAAKPVNNNFYVAGRGYGKFFNFEVDSACKICQKVFLSPELLADHRMVFHHDAVGSGGGGGGEADFRCKEEGCFTQCPSAALLKEHMERVHQAELPPSILASLSAPVPTFIPDSYLESGVELDKLTCSVCHLVFYNRHSLKSHFKAHHELAGLEESEVRRCAEPGCGAYFRSQLQLNVHMIRRHRKANVNMAGTQPVEGEEGDEETGTGGDYSNNAYARRRRLYCPVCPRWYFDSGTRSTHFKNWHDLNRWSRESSPSPVWRCEEAHCSAYFVKKFQLGIHLVEAHQARDPNKECATCGKYFQQRWLLQDHRFRMHKEEPFLPSQLFTCSVEGCGKQFPNEWRRRKHHRTVHDKTALKRSLPKRKSYKNAFVCELCGKVLASKLSLDLHTLHKHKGPDCYEFQCATCGKKFVSKGMLDRHLRTHTQEKPYVCQYCGKAWAHDNLRRHIRMNHPDAIPAPAPKDLSHPPREDTQQHAII